LPALPDAAEVGKLAGVMIVGTRRRHRASRERPTGRRRRRSIWRVRDRSTRPVYRLWR